ncbi:MAG: hypothetical protein JWN51_3075 [Phycisphaerales bacterium]|nr:hypothetical protein [Phycisphaerales bacterium]
MKSRLFAARLGISLLVPVALMACKKEPAATPTATTPPAKTESSTDQAATIEAAEDGALTLKMSNAAAEMAPLKEEGIALTLDGKKAAFGDLKPGWTVLVHMDKAGDKVASIEAFTPEFARERLKR